MRGAFSNEGGAVQKTLSNTFFTENLPIQVILCEIMLQPTMFSLYIILISVR